MVSPFCVHKQQPPDQRIANAPCNVPSPSGGPAHLWEPANLHHQVHVDAPNDYERLAELIHYATGLQASEKKPETRKTEQRENTGMDGCHVAGLNQMIPQIIHPAAAAAALVPHALLPSSQAVGVAAVIAAPCAPLPARYLCWHQR